MRPTRILEQEHRVIEQVLDGLQAMADRCQAEARLDAGVARDAIDFLRHFADGSHHAKEEAQLFPMMQRRGFPIDVGPIAVMLAEHEHGRALIRQMERAIDGAAAGESDACAAFVQHARGYIAMLREHIEKEDHCLFPMADEALTADDQNELAQSFQRVENDEIGAGVHEKYRRMAERLVGEYGVAAAGRAPEEPDRGCCEGH
ncbi:MAG: hemerythrin domain-containing protein [Acidobacteriota bacterium]|nr:MAG: hemerythrin domain-containing protein [Acidobacteriota bacterium]